jgi:excisionase family DNA binding protein
VKGMEKLLNVNEVSELLGESPEAIYRYCREGILPHYRLNRKIKFSAKKLEEFFENGGTKNNN